MDVWRGRYIESTHRVSACIVRSDGQILRSFGNTEDPFPLRSLAKPFIAIELIRSGACEEYDLGNVELALAAGSHDGEPRHFSAVRTFLAKIGASEDALLCGPAVDGMIVVGPPVRNGCSGKHAAVLAMCRYFSLDTDDYISPGHPIQRRLLPALLDVFDRRPSDTPIAIDGCSMPVFGASLHQIATAYARFSLASDPATLQVRNAMSAEPGYVGGWCGNLDTCIIASSLGDMIGKIGAEGLHADAITSSGLGIAIKVHDGNSRALPIVIAYLLAHLNGSVLTGDHLADLQRRFLFNGSGRRVGVIKMHDGGSLEEASQ